MEKINDTLVSEKDELLTNLGKLEEATDQLSEEILDENDNESLGETIGEFLKGVFKGFIFGNNN